MTEPEDVPIIPAKSVPLIADKDSLHHLTNLAWEIHKTAKAKGWWDKERDFGEIIANIHSEVSEAWEDYRAGNNPCEMWFTTEGKPCGITIELVDIMIRILDYLGHLTVNHDIDIDALFRVKMEYNKTRPHRHGGKKA